ncbi:MAG: NAD(P)/FAD-dependent oxidoreductase [Eubacterium sp.]
MIRINEIKLSLDEDEALLTKKAAKVLHINEKYIDSLTIYKKSIDARHRDDVHFTYSVDVCITLDENQIVSKCKSNKASVIKPYAYEPPVNNRTSKFRPVIVGFGPAGMLAGIILAEAGVKPIILERGKDIDARQRDVNEFWTKRRLNEESNVQFGEGGAGTFSDGKLTTGIKSPYIRKVLDELYEAGAPEEILYSAKPHIGTDRLAIVVKNIRKKIERLGGSVMTECKVEKLHTANGAVQGVSYSHRGEIRDIETDSVIMAIGHSARDTVEMLYSLGVEIIQKPFSVGARIEHPQSLINKAQYGKFANHEKLGAADYKLACHGLHERGAYTFCMCPGGTVVAAASEKEGVIVNGMSSLARDGENANSALLVGIEPKDFPSEHPLAGIYYQREIEHKAFELAGGDYRAPAQLVGDFLQNKKSTALGNVSPTCPTGVTLTSLDECLPQKVVSTMQDAIIQMDKKLNGFNLYDAVLTAPETRSSSSVRILRDKFLQCNIQGVYPCGEGAGYAGGIVSAAVDGIKCAAGVLSDEHF